MRNLKTQKIHIILIICFLLSGAFLLTVFTGTLKLAGFACIGISVLYMLYILFFGIDSRNYDENYRSQTRDQILKYQQKNKKPD